MISHEEFLYNLLIKNKHFKNNEFKIIGIYKKAKDYILVQDNYGLLKCIPDKLNKWCKPSIQSAIDRNEYALNQIYEIHKDKYTYPNFNYKGCDNKIKIRCAEHGIFEIMFNKHLAGGGCQKCAINNRSDKQRKSLTDFINEANKIHKNRYDYTEANYINTSTKLTIICHEHKEFLQTPNKHLSGRGCPKCSRKHNNYKLNYWKNTNKENIGIFYIIKCFNEQEEFIKIGITSLNSINERYNSKSKMPYSYEVILEFKSKNREDIWNREIFLKNKYKRYKYKPNIFFKGSKTECFSIKILKYL